MPGVCLLDSLTVALFDTKSYHTIKNRSGTEMRMTTLASLPDAATSTVNHIDVQITTKLTIMPVFIISPAEI